MNALFRFFLLVLTVVLFVPLPLLVGEETAYELERRFKVPGGGSLDYVWFDNKGDPQVGIIRYCGSPEWLASQKHPRSHWHTLPSLEEINFAQTKVTYEEIEYIASLKSVHSLDITETIFLANALAPLEHMAGLQALSLSFHSHNGFVTGSSRDRYGPTAKIDSIFFVFLDKLTALESLCLWGTTIDEATFTRICDLKKIQWLSLNRLGGTSAEKIALITRLDELEYLLVGEIENASPLLKALRQNQHLKTLNLNASFLVDTDTKHVAEMTELREIYLSGKSIASVASLKNLRKIKTIHLSFKEYLGANEFGFIADLPQLERLHIDWVVAKEFSLKHLQGNKTITRLEIPRNVLKYDDIAILESIPKLKYLHVGNCTKSNPNGSGLRWFQAAKRRLPKVKIVGQ